MDINILDKIVEEIESPLKVSGSKAHTFWGVNTASADAVIEQAQNRKLYIVGFDFYFGCPYQTRFYWPAYPKITQYLTGAGVNIKGINVHSPALV
jgi:diaminopimelate decarboxylase